MLEGFVSKKPSSRNYYPETVIHFVEKGETILEAQITEVSAGMLQFIIPHDLNFPEAGTPLELHFDLPLSGTLTLPAKLVRLKGGIDITLKRIDYLGAKLYETHLETWNLIIDYCQSQIPLSENSMENSYERERKDFRLTAHDLPAEVHVADGGIFNAKTKDISYGGVKIYSQQPLPVNQRVIVRLTCNESRFDIGGICIWNHPAVFDESGFVAGVFFEKLSPEEFENLRTIVFKLARSAPQEVIKTTPAPVRSAEPFKPAEPTVTPGPSPPIMPGKPEADF
jgi:hypothetical protein